MRTGRPWEQVGKFTEHGLNGRKLYCQFVTDSARHTRNLSHPRCICNRPRPAYPHQRANSLERGYHPRGALREHVSLLSLHGCDIMFTRAVITLFSQSVHLHVGHEQIEQRSPVETLSRFRVHVIVVLSPSLTQRHDLSSSMTRLTTTGSRIRRESHTNHLAAYAAYRSQYAVLK